MIFDIDNPGDRTMVELARSWGVPVSVFMGRIVTDGEPEWLEDDRRAAFDLMEYERGLCPGCKRPLAETTMAENEFRYRAEQHVRCHYCTASGQAGDRLQNLPQPGALLVPISLRGEQDAC